jgi:hypothetical protein
LGLNIAKDETLQLVIYAGWLFAAAVEHTDDSAFFPDFAGRQNDIDPATATEIHDNIPRLKVRKTSWITTSPGEIEH